MQQQPARLWASHLELSQPRLLGTVDVQIHHERKHKQQPRATNGPDDARQVSKVVPCHHGKRGRKRYHGQPNGHLHEDVRRVCLSRAHTLLIDPRCGESGGIGATI